MSVRELEQRCIRERQAMLGAAADIQHKLSPGRFVDQLLDASHTGNDYLSKLRHNLSDNPLLASLAGTGAAWFLFSKKKVKDAAVKVEEKAKEAETWACNEIAPAVDGHSKIEKDLEGLVGSAAASTHSVKDKFGEEFAEGKEAARRAVNSAETGFTRALAFVKEEPFVLLGAGLALGAALGAYAPTTEAESAAIGKAGDTFLREARAAVGDTLDAAKDAGARFYETVREDFKDAVTADKNGSPPISA